MGAEAFNARLGRQHLHLTPGAGSVVRETHHGDVMGAMCQGARLCQARRHEGLAHARGATDHVNALFGHVDARFGQCLQQVTAEGNDGFF